MEISGEYQLHSNLLAISMGYGVRVGLEENVWYDIARTKPAKNIELQKRVHILAQAN